MLAKLISEKKQGVEISGIDVMVRPATAIPTTEFDGKTIPFADASFDGVLFVDVLHHTDDPLVLLREAARVSRGCIVLKDHTLDGVLAGPTLRFMDRVGNLRHNVALPHNYWPRVRWMAAFQELGIGVEKWTSDLDLYPAPANWLFGRSLHFIARLKGRPS
jgi:SAM-dependent methyltransferase